ncbi:MAG TPA: hypothetical protein VJM77_07750 [Nitrospiria bacterium]|nr:hypothetical protein [Nitrospiria bacterium]
MDSRYKLSPSVPSMYLTLYACVVLGAAALHLELFEQPARLKAKVGGLKYEQAI